MNMGSQICGELDNSGVVDVCSNRLPLLQSVQRYKYIGMHSKLSLRGRPHPVNHFYVTVLCF